MGLLRVRKYEGMRHLAAAQKTIIMGPLTNVLFCVAVDDYLNRSGMFNFLALEPLVANQIPSLYAVPWQEYDVSDIQRCNRTFFTTPPRAEGVDFSPPPEIDCLPFFPNKGGLAY
jgi:hypothetical protein